MSISFRLLRFDGERVADAGDALALLARDDAHQCPRRCKQHALPHALPQTLEDVPGEDRGAAAAAAASGVGILLIGVVEQHPAVGEDRREGDALAPCEFFQQRVAEVSKVAGDDRIVVLRLPPGVAEVRFERRPRRGGKCQGCTTSFFYNAFRTSTCFASFVLIIHAFLTLAHC